MKRTTKLLGLLLALSLAACGSGDGASCDLPAEWSAASSGGLCQVNFFGETEYAVYCAENADGEYDCACGAAADDPPEFSSADFCDLEGEERACAAIEQCDFPL